MSVKSALLCLSFVSCVFSAILTGCNSLDDQLKNQASITGQAQADRQVAATNEDLERKSLAMEDDLATRQRFYQGVAGTYQGVFDLDGSKTLQIILTPSVSPCHSHRVRSLEEVISDLNALHLNAAVKLWATADTQASGKVFTGIYPDLKGGKIDLFASDYPNTFTIRLADSEAESANRARALLAVDNSEVPELWVEINATPSAQSFNAKIQRVVK